MHVHTTRSVPGWLLDPRLSLRARGLLAVFLAMPDAWDSTLQALSAMGRDSQATVRATALELQASGYLRVEASHHPVTGDVVGHTWRVTDGGRQEPAHPSTAQVGTKDKEREEINEKESDIKEKENKEERETENCRPTTTVNQAIADQDFPGLRDLLRQFAATLPFDVLDNQAYWVRLSYVTEVDDLRFLERELGKLTSWLAENPRRVPKIPPGWQRFVRVWLTRAFEQERRHAS